MGRNSISLCVTLLLLVTSCSYTLDDLISNSISELPHWITFIDDDLSHRDAIYVQLDESAIWEPGDDILDLRMQIKESLRITLDGIQVPTEDVILLNAFSPPVMVHDNTGKVIGSHGEFTHVYIFSSISSGMHTATLEVTTTSGVKYSYTWEFALRDNLSE